MALLNARSARLHHNDIMAHPVLRAVDILCLTEAHIYENQLEGYQRDGWTMTALPMSREDNCHGLVVYSSHRWPLEDISMSHDPHLEKLVLTTSDSQSPRSICLLYRSPSSDPAPFVQDITKLQEKIFPDIVLGDFNFNLDSPNYTIISQRLTNYYQIVSSPTHRSGSTLDLVFVKNTIPSPVVTVLPTYFSDHSIIYLHLIR
jgi:hypothetical protein